MTKVTKVINHGPLNFVDDNDDVITYDRTREHTCLPAAFRHDVDTSDLTVVMSLAELMEAHNA